MQYPLLFPYGTDGYSVLEKKKASAIKHYAYRFMSRDDNYLLKFRQLLNIFVVDMYVKVEAERMLYLKLNQKKLRAEEYVHLRDALLHDEDTENMGQLVILPSSYTGEIHSNKS